MENMRKYANLGKRAFYRTNYQRRNHMLHLRAVFVIILDAIISETRILCFIDEHHLTWLSLALSPLTKQPSM